MADTCMVGSFVAVKAEGPCTSGLDRYEFTNQDETMRSIKALLI